MVEKSFEGLLEESLKKLLYEFIRSEDILDRETLEETVGGILDRISGGIRG